jgi:hypothetical protein
MLLTYLNTTTVLTERVKCHTQYFNLSSGYESTYFVNTVKVSQIDFGQWDFIHYALRQQKTCQCMLKLHSKEH